jgi:UDP-2,3-diacylglucosamine pyrophosphatase LpxH
MISRRSLSFLVVLAFAAVTAYMQACKKEDNKDGQSFLTVTLPKATLQNDLYYTVGYNESFIELEFSETVDSSTVPGNLSFSDVNGSLDSSCMIFPVGRKVVLMFQPDFELKTGWKYSITVSTGLRSISGLTLPAATVIEIRTPALSLTLENDSAQRDAILCISDIHMGEARAVANKYCWFSKNEDALTDLLDLVLTQHKVRQVVILGDLFDEWVIPYRFPPFDSANGIDDSREYFLSVANSPVNQPVIDKLKAIASSGVTQLIYVPGNHDMLLTQEILQEIIPGVIWKGTSNGMGQYSPVNEIIMEHGHRFDFFNCPQPLVSQGHMLPPGFFISRLQAEGLRKTGGSILKETQASTGSAEFLTAWTLAIEYLKIQYSLTLHADSVNIRMGGIDGYTGMFSYNGARDMYAASIENVWPQTQQHNAVPLQMPVLMAILDGNMDLFLAAWFEYMSFTAPLKYKIITFGHTHHPELKVDPPGKNFSSIYSNTGSWVNAELSSQPVRTFLMIWPGQWTGSELDIVSLYQYNLDSGTGNPDPDYKAVLLAEESIHKNP